MDIMTFQNSNDDENIKDILYNLNFNLTEFN